MKILIVGGGPGGLYAALLLKKNHPTFDIEVRERNPADATYGWGVVFSDRTLTAFREADPRSYQQITDSFVLWTAIDTYYRDRLIQCDGHSFAGMSRRRLLQILQERARELGVRLAFNAEWTDFTNFGHYDLVIAADGVNSFIREHFAAAFRPSLSQGHARFIWLGTDRVLDAFTFIFRESSYGLFQAHAYPFDGTTSTFIVECAEDVWQRAGLSDASESASIAFCQDLFADFLHGRRLLSNNSRWINFVTVKNKTWRHKNIVLLGDSAHTAHFSIGSGTKLAMDGAIALAAAFAQTTDPETAANLYEMERRPRVEMLQAAAAESQTYFENIRRYLNLAPLPFVTNLLTRSGRITYDNLRVRDPFFVEGVDRHFGQPGNGTARPLVTPPPWLTPLTLRGLTLANRVAVAPEAESGAEEGVLSPGQQQAYAALAGRGAALLLTEPVAVTADGRITPGDSGLYDEAQADAWSQVAAAVHARGAWAALQLNHAGRRGATRPRRHGLDRPLASGAWPLLAPSDVPYHPRAQTPRAMDEEDMARVQAAFVRAADMAAAAGFDMLQLNMAHGYLLGSFLSPLTNRRRDAYGGTLENRLRFPLTVLAAVRAAWPGSRPLAVAINATDWAENGLTPETAVAIAHALKEHGCDLLELRAGQTVPGVQPAYGPGFLTPFSETIRHESGLPTLIGGFLRTSGEINAILAAGRADLCLMEAA